MKFFRKVILFISLFIFSLKAFSQAPAASKDILLQGFHWDSNAETSWHQLYKISGDLSANFDVVWLPPSAYSSGGTGYMPKQWSNQNSSWGSQDRLLQLINRLKSNSTRAMADIVVNHRDTKSTWVDFYEDDFGSYGKFQFNKSHITKDDEAVTGGHMSASEAGNYDTGENFDGTRDLDHTSTYVQDAVKAYLKWMKNVIGYDGWRYDMVKGFSAQYINGYNAAGGAYISVGEYWDGEYDAVWGWIEGTGKTSTAFDFPQKYAALNNGLAAGNYGNMAWSDNGTPRPAGLAHSPQSRRYSVTFVDNHDTYRDGSKFTGNIQQANAFILSSSGIPSVFYPHWRDNKAAINSMIKARKSVGLHSESNVEVQNTSGYYKAYGEGTCGKMLTYIGGSESNWDVPSGGGWNKVASGSGWAMYTLVENQTCLNEFMAKYNNGVNPTEDDGIGTLTLHVKVPSNWTSAKAWVWNTDDTSDNYTGGSWPGTAMTSLGDNIYKITINNITASEVGIVFNNGGSNATEQTIDLFTTEDRCWELIPTGNVKGYDATVSSDCFGLSSDVEVQEGNQLRLYPNPVGDKLYFKGNEQISEITVYSVNSEVLLQGKAQNNQFDVNLLSSGIYFVKVKTDSGKIELLKFMKK